MKTKNKKYEFVFILPSGLESKKKTKVLTDLEEQVKASKGKISDKKDWGERDFAYPIKKVNRGEYYIWTIEFSDDSGISKINVFLSREGEVLRYLWLLV